MKSLVMLLFLTTMESVVPAAFGAALTNTQLAQVRSDASNSLVIFQSLITPSNLQLMGFSETNEVTTATNGEPLLIYTMGFSQLTNYAPGSDLKLLLEPAPDTQPPPRVIVPIMAETNVRSAIVLREVGAPGAPGTHWTNMSWGKSGLIRDLIRTYNAVPHAQLMANTTPFAVEIPVFDIWLIGYFNHQNKLVLRSTTDMRLGPVVVNRNQIVTEAAMHQLRITAQRYNGFPN